MGRGLLLLVSGLVIIVGIIQKSVSDRLQFLPQRTTMYHQEMDAQNIANSLMEYGIRELENDQNWGSGFSSNDFMGAQASLQVFDYTDYKTGNSAIPADHSIQNWDPYTLLLVSTAKTSRTKAVTEVAITQDSFSRYTYFTDYEPSNIYFFDDDVLEGPVHTNGQLHIAGSPTFKGFVSSPNDWEGHPYYRNNPKFQGGTDFSSKEKEMPGADKLEVLKTAGQNGGLRFDKEINVEFKQNGTVEIAERQGWGWKSPVSYDLDSYNGVISSSETVHVQGTLKGKVTLHSEEKVEIMGDLVYANDPRKNPNSTDMLGIVSEGDVSVDYYAHTSNGRHDNQDLEINATIMALNKSFEAEYYSSGGSRGTLTLLGGIQQKERGPVGTFSNGRVQSGYSKDYSYDERLARMFPPFYPRESMYSQKYWKEKPIEYLSSN